MIITMVDEFKDEYVYDCTIVEESVIRPGRDICIGSAVVDGHIWVVYNIGTFPQFEYVAYDVGEESEWEE